MLAIGCADREEMEAPELPTELPILSIITDDFTSVDNREVFIPGTITMPGEIEDENVILYLQIKGRGNSTWNFPKKSYEIRFENAENVLGMPEGKKWILLANFSDKTMLRNEVAFNLSRSSGLDWTPESRYLELNLNHDYRGIYQITQKIDVAANKVDIGPNGFLLEADQMDRLKSDDVYFETENYLFNIKEPQLEFEDGQYDFIKEYIESTENALFGNDFANPNLGYAKYIDVNSFVDWYLINEITKNNDAIFFSSVYLNLTPGEKLKMGPVWDFDISLGNIDYNGNETTDGFWLKNTPWYARLFEDPAFVARVKSRFDFFYNNRDLFFEQIDTYALYLDEAKDRNFEKWPILGIYIWPNYVYYPTYDEEVAYLKNWLDERLEWLNISIHEL